MKSNLRQFVQLSVAFGGLVLLVAPGCRFFTEEHHDLPEPVGNHSTSEDVGTNSATTKTTTSKSNAATNKPLSDSSLADDLWVLSITKPGATEEPPFRWRNAALETWQLQAADPRTELERALHERDRALATNAAILLARNGTVEAAPVLLQAIQDPTTKLPQRRAAAEALASLTPDVATRNLHAALTAIEKKIGVAQPAYNPEVHAELLLALAKHCPAEDDPAFVQALSREESLVRMAALAHWAKPGSKRLPEQVTDLCENPDARLRVAAIKAVAARPADTTLEQLQRATRDQNLEVKMAAVLGLGQIKSEASRQTLERLLTSEGEIVRAAIVTALIAQGADKILNTAAKDKSWRVRLAAANSLGSVAAEQYAPLARLLLTDGSGDVQRATISAISAWPLSVAGPLWFTALEESGYLGRKRAAQQLAAHWPPAKDYSADAPAERRATRLADLREKWQGEFGASVLDLSQERSASPRPPSEVYTVPRLQALETAVERLRDKDIEERRKAAQEIALAVARQPLPDEILSHVVNQVIAEPDPAIWQSVLGSLLSDERPDCVRLACAGCSHPTADVRRRACEHLAAHGQAENAAVLVNTLNDSQASVQIAAAKGLGQIGKSQHAPALEALLLASDKTVRVAVAEGLLRLGAASGGAALERLSYDLEEKIRRQAVEAMGQSARPEFVPTFIRLLDDRAGVRQAALAALDRTVGRSVLHGHEINNSPDKTADLAQQYKRWHAEQAERR